LYPFLETYNTDKPSICKSKFAIVGGAGTTLLLKAPLMVQQWCLGRVYSGTIGGDISLKGPIFGMLRQDAND